MGDIADWLLEQEDYFQDRLDWLGSISANGGIVDDLDYDPEDFEDAPAAYSPAVTCHYCQRDGLHWEQRGAKWRMCDNRGVHRCPVNPLRRS